MGKCFVTLFVTSAVVSELHLEMICGAWSIIGNMGDGGGSERVPLDRNTGDFVKCPVPRFILLLGDVLSSVRGCP